MSSLASMAAELAVILPHYNCNENAWIDANTQYALSRWRRAAPHVYVILVEIAVSPAPFRFEQGVHADRVLQFHVEDVMWYKEMAINAALPHVPPSCEVVCWADSDVVVDGGDATVAAWVRRVVQAATAPGAAFVQPFAAVRMPVSYTHLTLPTKRIV